MGESADNSVKGTRTNANSGKGEAHDGLTQADYESLAAFRHALRRFVNFSTTAARGAGLTTHQHQALLAIKGQKDGTMTIGTLADTMIVAPHTAAELVVRLGGAGLVSKVEDATDRRRVVLRLTPKAEDALRQLTLMHLREVKVLAPRLMSIFKDLDAQLE